ncbi:SGNH/GDSL hydrolase family protein [Ostreiculturibacter nitratireducens]|uniref:SGNH/GDSL hydrolase family protein n=1 Tax=Ostreiculturibacter nitratireducens TaxID=3075226 RepID=UPI0031B59A08
MKTILCYGDSNTYGTVPMPDLDQKLRFGPKERWPRVMASELGPDWQVIEEGHPGRTTVHNDPLEGSHKNGLAVLPAILESHAPIDLVILKLGTNDLKARFSVTANDIARSAEKLAAFIRASDAGPEGRPPAVLMVAPPPAKEAGALAGMFAGAAEKSLAFGAEYAAAARHAGVAFLDAGQIIAAGPLDGIHYDAASHVALGEAMARAVFDMKL